MGSPPLSLAFSPCPNDTFMFGAIALGLVRMPGRGISVHLHDVQALNELAGRQAYDLSKLSCHAWLVHRERYRMLAVGGAFGRGCGPLVVARRPLDASGLARSRVLLPGGLTTAHLLFRLWRPEARDLACTTYDRIIPGLLAGEAGCGVIIHESRFTYREAGLVPIADLGAWWETETGLPIPLGCLAVRRDLPVAEDASLEDLLRTSILHARARPAEVASYMRAHARETDPAVLDAHVATFVNDASLDLGVEGRAAMAALEARARAAGAVP